MIVSGQGHRPARGSVATSIFKSCTAVACVLAAMLALSAVPLSAQEAPAAKPETPAAAAPEAPAAPRPLLKRKRPAPTRRRPLRPIPIMWSSPSCSRASCAKSRCRCPCSTCRPKDVGIAGAKLAIADNNTTGRFMNQEFTLDVDRRAPMPTKLIQDVVQKVDARRALHRRRCDARHAAQDRRRPQGQGRAASSTSAAPDDSLREENCRANVLHTAPTRSMLADALGQYLAWKQWRNWFLIARARSREGQALCRGPAALRQALRRQDRRGARRSSIEPGSRRADGGFEQVQQQIPTFTQNAPGP